MEIQKVETGGSLELSIKKDLSPMKSLDKIDFTADTYNDILEILAKNRQALHQADVEHEKLSSDAIKEVRYNYSLIEEKSVSDYPSSKTFSIVGYSLWFLIAYIAIQTKGYVIGFLIALIPGTIFSLFVAYLIEKSAIDEGQAKADEYNKNIEKNFHDKLSDIESYKQECIEDITRSTILLDNAKSELIAYTDERSKFLTNVSIHEAKKIQYEVDIAFEADAIETNGKPIISWYSPWLIRHQKWQNGEKDENGNSLVSASELNKHDEFINAGIKILLKIYCNKGGLITKSIEESATLLYSELPSSEGEFIHADAKLGETLNYYILLDFEFNELLHDSHEKKFKNNIKHLELSVASKRITIPNIVTDEELLEKDIKARTLVKKRQKFEESVAQTEARESGEDVDSTSIADEILEKRRKQKILEEKKQKNIDRITKSMHDDGASDEEIEEAIEEFLEMLS